MTTEERDALLYQLADFDRQISDAESVMTQHVGEAESREATDLLAALRLQRQQIQEKLDAGTLP